MFETNVICCKCGKKEYVGYASGITAAIRSARKKGWSVGQKNKYVNYTTLCPNCRKHKKRECSARME